MFEDIKIRPGHEEFTVPLSGEEVEVYRKQYPGIPEDYLTFLQEIGWGDLGPFMLYSGPINPDFVYGPRGEELPNIILLGDDMQGYCFGYDMEEDFQLVELDPRAEVNYKFKPTFTELVRHRLQTKSNA